MILVELNSPLWRMLVRKFFRALRCYHIEVLSRSPSWVDGWSFSHIAFGCLIGIMIPERLTSVHLFRCMRQQYQVRNNWPQQFLSPELSIFLLNLMLIYYSPSLLSYQRSFFRLVLQRYVELHTYQAITTLSHCLLSSPQCLKLYTSQHIF